MSKYIRTKDGRIITCNESNISWCMTCEQGIKYADTIKELGDEFVVWKDGYETPISMPLNKKEEYGRMEAVIRLAMLSGINCWLKLAIWTDEGLIYFAEMNDKGDFKLL